MRTHLAIINLVSFLLGSLSGRLLDGRVGSFRRERCRGRSLSRLLPQVDPGARSDRGSDGGRSTGKSRSHDGLRSGARRGFWRGLGDGLASFGVCRFLSLLACRRGRSRSSASAVDVQLVESRSGCSRGAVRCCRGAV